MPLEAADRKVLDDALAAAANAEAAAESAGSRLDALTANVEALVRVVERQRAEIAELRDAAVLAVTDVDHPNGATYLVTGCGSAKVWILPGDQWADLVNRFPHLSPPERWSGSTLAAIPTVGPDPPTAAP